MSSRYPTIEQLRHLVGHTEYRVLTPAEAARLRSGVDHLAASQAGLAAKADDLSRRLAAGARPVIDVDCPLCPAHARSRCVHPSGQHMRGWHQQRLEAAARPSPDSTSTDSRSS